MTASPSALTYAEALQALAERGRFGIRLGLGRTRALLREQVRSICLQTLPPKEIVLADDASRDGSVALVRALVDECAREPIHTVRGVGYVMREP